MVDELGAKNWEKLKLEKLEWLTVEWSSTTFGWEFVGV